MERVNLEGARADKRRSRREGGRDCIKRKVYREGKGESVRGKGRERHREGEGKREGER